MTFSEFLKNRIFSVTLYFGWTGHENISTSKNLDNHKKNGKKNSSGGLYE